MRSIFVLPALVLSSLMSLPAADHYVRTGAGGSGSGSDWTNAYASLPAILARGDTYYLADGSYGSYRFDDAVSGTVPITVRKATAANHGAAVDWNPSYGDGVARFGGVAFATSYHIFEGAVGQGESGHGIEIYDESSASISSSLVSVERAVSDIALRHLSMHRPTRNHKGIGVYAVAAPTRVTVSDCYIYDMLGGQFYFIDASGVLIERCHLARNTSTPEWHGEAIQARGTTGMIIRYSWFEDIQGTGVIVSGSGNSSNWEVYGNVFHIFEVGHGVLADNQLDSITGVKFYNNTIVKGGGICSGVRLFNAVGTNQVYDNLWYDSTGVFHTGVTYDYNYYANCAHVLFAFAPGAHEPPKDSAARSSITADPLVDSLAEDFHLKHPLVGYPGLTLADAYGTDPENRTRGADGVWERGAFELSASASDLTPPTVPTGLTASAVSSTQIDLRWTAATDDTGVTGYRIFRGGIQIGTATTTTATTYRDTGLTPGTSYSYLLRAIDAAGNLSSPSATVAVTTMSAPTSTNQVPVVSTVTATPSPVTATTARLSATATDDSGESALAYTWSATGPVAVAFSPNGSNAAKVSTATFSKAGSYTVTVSAKDAGGLSATKSVAVTVNATPSALSISPTGASVQPGMTVDFNGMVSDQFNVALTTQPALTWTVSGGGTINANGLFTAGAGVPSPSGGVSATTYVVTATVGDVSGTGLVTVSTASTALAESGGGNRCGGGSALALIGGLGLMLARRRRG